MKEIEKTVTIESTGGLVEMGLQREIARQAALCATADMWSGNAEPGVSIQLDGDVTLNGVKFITDVGYSDIDVTSGAAKITVNYIAYEK